MRQAVLALFLSLSTASCASAYKVSYVTGAVTKEFTTENYKIYSEQFNKKLDECKPENNPNVTTKTELDKCMGKYFEHATHEKIELAVEVYYKAAEAHTGVMIATKATDEERRTAAKQVLDAAIGLISLFPNGEKLVKKLKMLTRR